MKYRTVIELVCNAKDAEDASHMAGDYLNGTIDFGVDMRCKTTTVCTHRVKKYVFSVLVLGLFVSSFIFGNLQVGDSSSTVSNSNFSSFSTSTVMPALKTQEQEKFKEEWENKKDEAVLEYIKK